MLRDHAGRAAGRGVRVISPVRESMADPPSPEMRERLNARRRILETVSARLAGRAWDGENMGQEPE